MYFLYLYLRLYFLFLEVEKLKKKKLFQPSNEKKGSDTNCFLTSNVLFERSIQKSSSSQIRTLIKNLVFGFSEAKSARKLLCNTLLDFRSKLVAFKQVLCYSLLQLSKLKGSETHTYYTQFCWRTLLPNFLPRQI